MSIKINKNLIKRNRTALKRSKANIKYIVIHYVGALGDAKANIDWYGSGDRGASADFFVGHGGDIWQANDFYNYYSWHCGGGRQGSGGGAYFNKCTNSNSIGIEMCVKKQSTKTMNATDKDWYFTDATIQSTMELVKHLIKELDIDHTCVIRHYGVTGKICPNPFVYDTGSMTWSKFKASLMEKEIKHTMSKECTYKVQAGDTLSAIAKHFGITLKCLRKVNNLTSDTIKIGQVLKLYYWIGTIKKDVPLKATAGSKKQTVKTLKKGENVFVCGSTKSAAGNKWYKVWEIDAKKVRYVYGKRIKKNK